MYTSNKFYNFLFKYILLIIFFIILIIGIIGYYAPFLVSFNDRPITMNQTIIMMFVSLLPLIAFIFLRRKFVVVTVDHSFLYINELEEKYKWNQITVSQIPFIFPPLYRLQINKRNGYMLFNTNNIYLWLSLGIVKDLSPMGQFIERKIKVKYN